MRFARTEPLYWAWPVEPGDIDALRAYVRDAREARGESPRGDDHACAVYLRHDCSDYELMFERVGKYAPARQALRERVADEVAAAFPDLTEVAHTAAARESEAMRLSSARTADRSKRLNL